MKYLISHRGNIFGPQPELENHPDYIQAALESRYDVEIDVWVKDKDIYLGHDKPQYLTNLQFISNPMLWCHAKNSAALELRDKCHIFWHEEDERTLTSLNFAWTYPGKTLIKNSIAVLPERFPDWDLTNAVGICSDFIRNYKNNK
jgi:hypothetical protein